MSSVTINSSSGIQKSTRSATALEFCGGFAPAELTSMGVSLGVVAVLDNVIPKEIMGGASKVIAKVCIEPFQDIIEKGMRKFAKLEEFKVDETKSKEQRAEEYAHAVMVFGAAYAVSMWAKLSTRRFMNKSLGIGCDQHIQADEKMGIFRKKIHDMNPANWSRNERNIFLADEGVHFGSIILMNANQTVASATDEHIKTMSSMLEKMGISQEKAKELSSYAMIYELPNLLGMGAGGLAILNKHSYSPSQNKYNGIKDILSGVAKSEYSIAGH